MRVFDDFTPEDIERHDRIADAEFAFEKWQIALQLKSEEMICEGCDRAMAKLDACWSCFSCGMIKYKRNHGT